MDRNQIIGFALLALLVIGYFTYNSHEQKLYFEQKHADSVANAKTHPRPVVDSSNAVAPVAPLAASDSATEALKKLQPSSYYGQAQSVTLESKKLAVQFSTKGAFPTSANIKGYKTYYGKDLELFAGKGNQLSAILPFDNNKSTADLYFTPVMRDEPNGDKTVDFSADLGGGKKVDIIYSLPADDYMMRCSIVLTGLPANNLVLNWQTLGLHTEKDVANERMASQVYYHTKSGDQDYFTVRNEEKQIHVDKPASWLGFRKQYFSTALVSDEGFTKLDDKFFSRQEDTNVAAQNLARIEVPLKPGSGVQSASFKWFIGPNDYHILASYKLDMEDMVPLGTGIMAFVKYVNRFAIVPLFYFLNGFIGNIVVVILLMTLIVRLVLSFFTYKSYLSSAKMRVMKPEMDELRAKTGDDQQKFSMEQMKLYRAAGVNPLGGCLPMVFQMPILLSMYYMFPSFIEFRQQHFLWARDLSTYDSVLNFGFSIPLYGDHLSLFTLLFTASSLFLALYNRNMTPQDPNNPMMKYMPFIFPVILMGVFNKMAAALTVYYFISNILSMVQQFVIQKYFIDEKAIHAQLQQNKSKPAASSKWQQRLEEMQKMQTERAKVQPRTNKK